MRTEVGNGWWQKMSPSLEAADESGRNLTNPRGGHSFALGSQVVKEGRHSFFFEITSCGENTCAGLFIGVMNAEKTFRDIGATAPGGC